MQRPEHCRAAIAAGIGILMWLFQGHAWAATATTGLGFIACREEQWLDEIFKYIANGDDERFQASLDSDECLIVDEGLTVTLDADYSDTNDTVEYVYDGVRYWTIKEALHDVTPD